MCNFFKKLYYSKHPDKCKHKSVTRSLDIVERKIGRNIVQDIYGIETCDYCKQVSLRKRLIKDISVKRPEELSQALDIAKREWLGE